ncbi:MAG TPA: response regulator [Opitutaceae bacterium]|nr:response regulator [Opitutaceae bacterium]
MNNNPIHVLLVEDDANDFELIAQKLRQADRRFEVRCVDTQDGLQEELPRLAPDIVLCDHASARWDSLAVLEQVRAFEPNMPFVVVSGALNEWTRAQLEARGVDGVVLKDRLPELPGVVRDAIRTHEERQRERVREIREHLLAQRPGRRARPALAAG